MRIPKETQFDALVCLDRPSLDSLQICSRQYRQFVNQMGNICLRDLSRAVISQHYGKRTPSTFSYSLIAVLGAWRKKAVKACSDDTAGQRFAAMIASSYIKRLAFSIVPLTDRLLQPLQVMIFSRACKADNDNATNSSKNPHAALVCLFPPAVPT